MDESHLNASTCLATPLFHGLPMCCGQFESGLEGFVLEKRRLVANVSANCDALA